MTARLPLLGLVLLAAMAPGQQLPAVGDHPKRPVDPPVFRSRPSLPPTAALAHLRAAHRRAQALRTAAAPGGEPGPAHRRPEGRVGGDDADRAPLPRPAGAGRFVVAVLACADAAVDVPALLGLDPQDVLLISNAGAEADPATVALLEWAVRTERLSLCVVLTHRDCPSLGEPRTLGTPDGTADDAPDSGVPGAAERLGPARALAARRREPLLRAYGRLQCERLGAASDLLRGRVADGRLLLVSATVDPRDGELQWHTTRAEESSLPPVK